MRPEKISNLNSLDRIVVGNDNFLNYLLEPDDFNRLKRSIENGDLLGIDINDKSNLFGTIQNIYGDTLVVFDLLPEDTFKLVNKKDYLVVLLEPGDEGFEKPNPPEAPEPPKYPGLIKQNKNIILKMLADIILSTISRTTTNRAEFTKAQIEDKISDNEIKELFDNQEAYELFQQIFQDLEKDEAKRLGTTAPSVFITPTPAPIVKRPRKKKEPALPEPTQIPTTDTSVFNNDDELSSLLDEFLT